MTTRPLRATSVLWGLILVAVGGILLARNLGYPVPIWTGLATYWPILLIVWGAVKVVDYVLLRHRGETRRLFSPGEVFLLIFVVLIGSAATAAARLNPELLDLLEMADIDIFPITGEEYNYTEHYESDAIPGSTIEIVNRYGNIDVRPDTVDRITVDVEKTVIAETQEDADELAQVLVFGIRQEAPGYRIVSTFNRDQNSVRGRRFRTSLTIRVPVSSSLRVDNRNGDIMLIGLQGDQSVDNGFGAVTIRDVSGNLDLDNRNGTVTVENVTGSVSVDNSFAQTHVRNIGADLSVDTRNGLLEVSDVDGDATLENAFAPVRVSNVNGDLSVDSNNSEVEIAGIAGRIAVETAFQNIDVRDARRGVSVENRNGDVDVRFSEPPPEDVTITTQFSNVTLILPASSQFDLDLSTRFGEIDTDLGLRVASDGPGRGLTGRIGTGGPTIRIRNRNGDIRLERR